MWEGGGTCAASRVDLLSFSKERGDAPKNITLTASIAHRYAAIASGAGEARRPWMSWRTPHIPTSSIAEAFRPLDVPDESGSVSGSASGVSFSW